MIFPFFSSMFDGMLYSPSVLTVLLSNISPSQTVLHFTESRSRNELQDACAASTEKPITQSLLPALSFICLSLRCISVLS